MKRFLLSITTCFSIIFAHPQLIEAQTQERAETLRKELFELIGEKAPAQTQEQDGRTKRNVPDGYVDLGLPSGTLWKDQNEAGGFYTYAQAVARFGNSLPTKEQLEELKNTCRWTWNGKGYKVEGPSGDSIVLPAAGVRYCDGSVHNVGLNGCYWSSTPGGSEYVWGLYFSSSVSLMRYYRCNGQSVRLVR